MNPTQWLIQHPDSIIIALSLSALAIIIMCIIKLNKQTANINRLQIELTSVPETLSQLLQHNANTTGQLQQQQTSFELFKTQLQDLQAKLQTQHHQHLTTLSDGLGKASQSLQQQLSTHLAQHSTAINQQFKQLNLNTQNQLNNISTQVDSRLNKGFERTTKTFQDILQRLTIIDNAQQKITELSSNVVSLQEILSDKQSRGAFGEVQLTALIRNMIPEKHLKWQHTLSNGKRADCILFLPKPTGNMCIDSKFPLENYQNLDNTNPESKKQFARDIKKHIDDIAKKYIIKNETSDSAMMFIPAEAIFAEIHAHHPKIVDYAHQKRVWLTSPTTMMAILTTVGAVLKDAATREQIHIIQEHLHKLGEDFGLFQQRMNKLAKHINQTQQEVEKVHISSRKISSRFQKIETVDLDRTQQKDTQAINSNTNVNALEDETV